MSDIVKKNYIKIKDSSDNIKLSDAARNINYLKVELRYDLGGFSVVTYRNNPRGYYLDVTPIAKGDGWESFGAFTGVGGCILECTRKSKKQAEIALVKAKEMLPTIIKNHFSQWEYESEVSL